MVAKSKRVILIPAVAYLICKPCNEITEQEVFAVVNKGSKTNQKYKVTYSCTDCRSINYIELT